MACRSALAYADATRSPDGGRPVPSAVADTSGSIVASTSVTVSRVIRQRSRFSRASSSFPDSSASPAHCPSTRARAAASRASNSQNSEPTCHLPATITERRAAPDTALAKGGCRRQRLESELASERRAVNTHNDWAGVRERVIAVEEAERGARGHAPSPYPVFDTVLTPAEIAEAEAQFGVALPEEYRSFLAEVGAGGSGPAIDLTSLRRIDGTWGWVWENDEDHPWLLDASGPLVETQDWADQQWATLRAAGHEPTSRDEEDEYRDAYREAFGDGGEARWHLERGRGAIHISDNGCGMTGWLIVVGPHRGELRDRDCAVNPPFESYKDAQGNPHTFRSWYLEWLEQRERATR